MAKKRVLVVGLGNMGMSHALAYTRIDGFHVAALCERNIAKRQLPKCQACSYRFAVPRTSFFTLLFFDPRA